MTPLTTLALASVALLVVGVGTLIAALRWLEEIDGRRVRM